MPPALRDGLPEGLLALCISDVVDTLDLPPIVAAYEAGDGRGQPPYHPATMVKLLVYAYCTGTPSSRQSERATSEQGPDRVLAADQQPDHDRLAAFRKRHLEALGGLFTPGLPRCRRAGVVTLGQVALDGTTGPATASKPNAMSDARMGEAEQKLRQEVASRLEQAQPVDAAEDTQYGPGRRSDALPAERARRESRLRKLREATAALEQETQARAPEAPAGAAGGRDGPAAPGAPSPRAGPGAGDARPAGAAQLPRPGLAH